MSALPAILTLALALGASGCDARFRDRGSGAGAKVVDATIPIVPQAISLDGGPAAPLLVKVGRLLDGVTATPKLNQAILVVDGRIRDVGPRETLESEAPGAKVIDLG